MAESLSNIFEKIFSGITLILSEGTSIPNIIDD